MSENTSMMEKVSRYLEHRRSLGYKLRTSGSLLRSFARQADQYAPGKPLTVAWALQWATEPKSANRVYHAGRLNALRAFARYLVTFEPQTEIPPSGILGPSFARITPHIYTKEETLALIKAARTVKPKGGKRQTIPLRNATILGLLACTGMRIGEVLALRNQDVDLAQCILTVRQSKSLPMRLVPITGCAARRLREYQEARDACFGPSGASEPFIRSAWAGPLSYSSFRKVFKYIRERAALNGRNATGRKVRMHDFRHTFACNHLLRAYHEGRNIDNAVHDLSVYLGHAMPESTYWYLTAIPELFEQCTKRFEADAMQQRNGGGT